MGCGESKKTPRAQPLEGTQPELFVWGEQLGAQGGEVGDEAGEGGLGKLEAPGGGGRGGVRWG